MEKEIGRKMKKEYSSIEKLLKANLNKKEDPYTKKLLNKFKKVRKRGYLTKTEFLEISLWKSPRAKPRYLKNSEEQVRLVTKKVMSTKFEKRKIELLTGLKGVAIPVASAILMFIDPKHYGTIDIRAWQTLYVYGSVKTKPKGQGLSFKNWYLYHMKLRAYAKKLNITVRDVERTLYRYHSKIQKGNLYG